MDIFYTLYQQIVSFRSKKTLLPEQSQLEEKRSGSNKTLFDQMVEYMNRHKKQFPTAIHDAAHKEEDPELSLQKRIRNIVERMLKFYMKGMLNILHNMTKKHID